jgi:quercetin dioxygenase-like cupin family protein
MNRCVVLLTVVVLLALASPGDVAFGQQPPPGPSVRFQTKFEIANQPAEFEIIQMVLDFAPGAWTPPHTHGGPIFATLMEGELTVRGNGGESKYGAGKTFVEIPGEVLEVGNATGLNARVLVTALLPKGAALTTVQQTTSQQPPPGPTTVYQYRAQVVRPAPQFDVVHQVLDFAPGAYTPAHYHGGQGFVTVVEGEQSVSQKGTEQRLKAGETWVEDIGVVAVAGNPGPAKVTVVATFLLPIGAQLTTLAQTAAPATLPQTGAGTGQHTLGWLLVGGGGGLIAWGRWMRRRVRGTV